MGDVARPGAVKTWGAIASWSREWQPAVAKFRRARSHFADIVEGIDNYFEQQPIVVVEEMRPDGWVVDVFLAVVKQPPLDLSVMVGDMVHNLRSCLNLALRAVWTDAPSMVDFPIFTKPRDFRKWVRDWEPPDDLAVTLEKVQPYSHASSGNAMHSTLDIVRRLNNTDKHRGLILLPLGLGFDPEHALLAAPEGLLRDVVVRLTPGPLARRTLAFEMHLRAPYAKPQIQVEIRNVAIAIETYWRLDDLLDGAARSVEEVLISLHEA